MRLKTTKKPCLSACADTGRLFFTRGLLPSESPKRNRRLSGVEPSITRLRVSVKQFLQVILGKVYRKSDGKRGFILRGISEGGGQN